jgi:hypothetical protein
MRIFGQLLLVDKQKSTFIYIKQHLKSVNFCTKVTQLPLLATMTFQDGGYFGFKVI